MPVSSSAPSWTLRMPQGSYQPWAFTFTQADKPGGHVPWGIDPAAWEYAVTDAAGNSQFRITPTLSAAGQLTVTVTASLSQVMLQVYSAATATLAPGTYRHALWEYPGTPQADSWFSGNLIIEGVPQP